MQKRNILSSPRLTELKQKKRKIFIRKIILLCVAFVVLVAILSLVSHIGRLNIDEVEVVGNKIIDTEAIQEVTRREIGGKYLWLFPRTNILIYPGSGIQDALENEFKRLKDITIGLTEGTKLKISLTERSGKYIWCGEAPKLEADATFEQCYFLDEDGYIFDKAPYFSGEVYFKFYGLVDPLPPGSYFSGGEFRKMIIFKEGLEKLDLKPVTLQMENNGDNKIFLSKGKAASQSPEIIFNTEGDPEILAENLKAALNTEPLKSKFADFYSSLLYIDLRFGNKVYYKFR